MKREYKFSREEKPDERLNASDHGPQRGQTVGG